MNAYPNTVKDNMFIELIISFVIYDAIEVFIKQLKMRKIPKL